MSKQMLDCHETLDGHIFYQEGAICNISVMKLFFYYSQPRSFRNKKNFFWLRGNFFVTSFFGLPTFVARKSRKSASLTKVPEKLSQKFCFGNYSHRRLSTKDCKHTIFGLIHFSLKIQFIKKAAPFFSMNTVFIEIGTIRIVINTFKHYVRLSNKLILIQT